MNARPVVEMFRSAQAVATKVAVYAVTVYFALWGAWIGKTKGKEVLLAYLGGYWRAVRRALHGIGGVETCIEGEFPQNPNQAVLYLPTHESALDTFLFFGTLPRPAYVEKHDLFKLPLFGYCMRVCEMIPVDKVKPDVRRLKKEVKQAFMDNRQVVFFPEGMRVAPGAHTVVSPGTAMVVLLALELGVPVVPVTIAGWNVWGPPNTLRQGRPGVLRVRFGEPLSFEEEESEIKGSRAFRNHVERTLVRVWADLDR